MNKKTIWITGGSTGIGKALAIKFANEGWNVAISARRENLLREISDNHENINSFPLDVTNKDKCKEVFNNIKNQFENIDICFFSTGTWDPKKEKDIDLEQMQNVFQINFFGTVNCIKAVEQYFRDKKNGIITIVSSIAGYRGLPNSTGYGPSKSALNNLAESLYFDFKRHNVRVCLVSPGFIKTAMTEKIDDKYKEAIISKIPSARLGEPQDVANAVLFLASNQSNYINGETVHVNGGMYMA